MSDDVYASMIPFQDIMRVLYRAAPRFDKYGTADGASTELVRRYLADPKIIDRVGAEMFRIQTAYASKTRGAMDVIAEAQKAQNKAIEALVEEVKAMSRAKP